MGPRRQFPAIPRLGSDQAKKAIDNKATQFGTILQPRSGESMNTGGSSAERRTSRPAAADEPSLHHGQMTEFMVLNKNRSNRDGP
jgi:hypothetical protein